MKTDENSSHRAKRPAKIAEPSIDDKKQREQYRSDRPARYTPTEVAAALRQAHGIHSVAAQILGCNVNTVRKYEKRYKTVREAYHEGESWQIDLAKSKLLENISSRKEASIFFLLKTKGGYIEKHEIRHAELPEIKGLLIEEEGDDGAAGTD